MHARLKLGEADETRLVGYLEEHAEGNPLYISELVRNLQEERFLEPGQGTWTLHDLALAPVPPLLRKVIERRLQRLGDAALIIALFVVLGFAANCWGVDSRRSGWTIL